MVEYAPLFRLHARASWHFYERGLYPCGIVSPPSFWARRSRAKPKHRIFLSQKPSGGTFLTVKDAVKNQKCKYLLSFLLFSRESNKRSVYIKRTIFYMTLFVKKSISICVVPLGTLRNEINPLRDLWNALRAWNSLSASEMPAGVRGFISFHIEQSDTQKNSTA